MDPQQLQKLRVVDLKEILIKKGLSTSGLKADLVRRLRDSYVEENKKDGDCEVEMKQEPENQQEDEEEEIRQKQAEAAMHQLAQQQQIMAEEEKIRLAEEQQRLLAEEQQRLMAEEQQRLLAEEQRRLLEEQQQHALAEQQQTLLMEQQQKQMVEEQQKMLAEQQQKYLGEQQHKMLSEQQKIFSERDKEKELFQLQQQALREKEEEKLQQPPPPPPLPMVTSNPIETHVVSAPTAVVTSLVPSHLPLPVPPPIPQPPQLGHVLPVSSQQVTSNAIHMFTPQMPPPLSSMNIPPPPTILVSSLAVRPPPRHLSSNTSVPAPNMSHQIAPPGIHPPTMPTSMQQFTQPPPPASSIVATTVSNVFPPPPPPLSVTLESKPVQNSVNEIAKKPSEGSQKTENQVPAGTNSDQTDEIKLPHVVEKILALKNERAQQLGVDPDSVIEAPVELKESSVRKPASRALVSVDEDDDMDEEETNLKVKESKGRRRKKKKKQKRPGRFDKPKPAAKEKSETKEKSVDIDIEYVQDVLDPADPLYATFVKIFEKFKLSDPEKDKMEADLLLEEMKREPKVVDRKKPMDLDDDDDDDDDMDEDNKEEEKPKLSKRKLKKLSRMTVAELKQKVIRPELVEMHDVTAKDPVLLLHLKASRNTVPVPRHWCFKRKYLQGKRGIEKPAFELPDFIKRTGIMEMRQALQEKEDQKTMKAKMRERVRPKLGKIDIDYQKLHDAFFKWQTKPKMTIHGDLYYEGKEFETRLKEKKPGDLSDDLRIALGMPTGPNANKCPPPWLIAMQRYGPPPSYPNLKIPGLNAPIPDSCSFGYHAGGWGKPPVDEMGRPLYGDVFGIQNAENQPHIPEEEIDHTLWGELESESSEEEEDEEDEDEEEEEQKGEDDSGLVTPAEGLITPSGFSSIPAGMETPDMIELRKRKIEAEMEGGETPALYTILPEKKSERVGAAMMGSTHIYDYAAAIPAAKVKIPGTASVPPQGIEVALDPSELEMDTAAMAARYEQTMREQQSQLEKEDLSDMVAEHAARQKTKRKKQQQDSGKAPKKYKEFKF